MMKEASPAQSDGEKRSDAVTVEKITVRQKPMEAESLLDGRARRAESPDRRGEAPEGATYLREGVHLQGENESFGGQ